MHTEEAIPVCRAGSDARAHARGRASDRVARAVGGRLRTGYRELVVNVDVLPRVDPTTLAQPAARAGRPVEHARDAQRAIDATPVAQPDDMLRRTCKTSASSSAGSVHRESATSGAHGPRDEFEMSPWRPRTPAVGLALVAIDAQQQRATAEAALGKDAASVAHGGSIDA